MEFFIIRIPGACAEGSLWPHFCMLVCVFLIRFRDQCLSEFANLMAADLYLGNGIPHSSGLPIPQTQMSHTLLVSLLRLSWNWKWN